MRRRFVKPMLLLGGCMLGVMPDAAGASPVRLTAHISENLVRENRTMDAVTDSPAELHAAALAALQEVLRDQKSWIQVHAAEALLAQGEHASVRAVFEDLDVAGTAAGYRIGVWRVLANASRTQDERTHWTQRIEQIAQDPAAPDRKQAIESLGKLAQPVSAACVAALQAFIGERSPEETVLAWWSLHHCGDPKAMVALRESLRRPELLARQRAAYVLRWIHPTDQATTAALAQAATDEPKGTLARTFIISAALALVAPHSDRAQWRQELESILFDSASTAARFEAAQSLAGVMTDADASRVRTLLDDPDADVRVAGAGLILSLLPATPQPASP